MREKQQVQERTTGLRKTTREVKGKTERNENRKEYTDTWGYEKQKMIKKAGRRESNRIK